MYDFDPLIRDSILCAVFNQKNLFRELCGVTFHSQSTIFRSETKTAYRDALIFCSCWCKVEYIIGYIMLYMFITSKAPSLIIFFLY